MIPFRRRPEAEQACSHEHYRIVAVHTGQVPIEVHRCTHRPGCRHTWIVVGEQPPGYEIAMMVQHVLRARCA